MRKILLVEDDLTLLALYEKTLSARGLRIVRAVDGQDALVKIDHENFDLIITDLHLPRVSGQKFIEFVLNRQDALHCPIIVSSGHIDNGVINSFASHSRIHFLPKPTSSKELIEKVEKLLSKADAPSKTDVRFVNPVLNATIEVVKTLTDFKIEAGRPFVKKSDDTSGDISGVVGVVSSGFKGTISLSFSERGFLQVLSKMLNEECTSVTDENKNAVAEILNSVFGKAKKALNEGGLNILPAIPSIVLGKSHSIYHHSKEPTIVIPFHAPEIGEFRSEISSSS